MAALSAHAPTRPHRSFQPVALQRPDEGVRAELGSAVTCTTVPFGSRSAIALWSAETARDAFIRESME
jgi:hypothetical protein